MHFPCCVRLDTLFAARLWLRYGQKRLTYLQTRAITAAVCVSDRNIPFHRRIIRVHAHFFFFANCSGLTFSPLLFHGSNVPPFVIPGSRGANTTCRKPCMYTSYLYCCSAVNNDILLYVHVYLRSIFSDLVQKKQKVHSFGHAVSLV